LKETKISLHVQPGAGRSEIVGVTGGIFRIRISAPAHEGKANKALIDFLSEKLDIAKSRIEIVKGQNSKDKVIAVSGLSLDEVRKRLVAE